MTDTNNISFVAHVGRKANSQQKIQDVGGNEAD